MSDRRARGGKRDDLMLIRRELCQDDDRLRQQPASRLSHHDRLGDVEPRADEVGAHGVKSKPTCGVDWAPNSTVTKEVAEAVPAALQALFDAIGGSREEIVAQDAHEPGAVDDERWLLSARDLSWPRRHMVRASARCR